MLSREGTVDSEMLDFAFEASKDTTDEVLENRGDVSDGEQYEEEPIQFEAKKIGKSNF